MQPINDRRLQNQVTVVPQKISRHNEASPNQTKTAPHRNLSALPEDIVTLSTDQSSIAASAVIKKPSIPVSTAEKKALRDSFSVYA